MTTHEVKSWTHLFQAIKSGQKLHDIRDMRERDYKVDDFLILKEFDYTNGTYTGDWVVCRISYITSYETPCALSSVVLDKGYAVLSVVLVNKSLFQEWVMEHNPIMDDVTYITKEA